MLAQNIKKLRKQRKLSQEELAKKAGVTYSTLIKLESGVNKNPTIKTIQQIAAALDVISGRTDSKVDLPAFGLSKDRYGPTACPRAPTSMLGRSFLRGPETRGKDAACLWPKGGRQRNKNLSTPKKEVAPHWRC